MKLKKVKHIFRLVSLLFISFYCLICIILFIVFNNNVKPNSRDNSEYTRFIQNKNKHDETITIDKKDFKYHYFDNKSKNTIILLHGIGSNKDSNSLLAQQLYNSKNNIILFDLRNHTENKNIGTTPTFGYWEKEDLLKIIQHHKSKYTNQKIKLYGVSMGAASVLAYAQKYDYLNLVDSYICESVYANMFKQVNLESKSILFSGLYPFRWGLDVLFMIFNNYSTYYLDFTNKMNNIKHPMMLLTPNNDPRINKSNSHELYNKSNKKYVKLKEFNENTHAEASLSKNKAKYFKIVKDYFKKN